MLIKVELTTGSRRVHGSRRVLVALAVYCSVMSSYNTLVERQSIALASMPEDAASQARRRHQKALERKDNSFRPRGESNRAAFEKLRETMTKDINTHVSSQADRIIEAVDKKIADATKDQQTYWKHVGGSGSSTNLFAQAASLQARAKEKLKQERQETRDAVKAAEKETKKSLKRRKVCEEVSCGGW